MKRAITILAALLLPAVGLMAATNSVTVPLRWDIRTDRPSSHALTLYRGESVLLQPRYLSYGSPLDLSGVYAVVLRYRSPDMPEDYYYAATGSVSSAAEGRISIPWNPACEAAADRYAYTIAVKASNGSVYRGFGTITLRGTVSGSATNMPPQITTTFDWAAVEHINISAAPFLNDADVVDIRAGIADNTAAISSNRAVQAVIDAQQDAAISNAAAAADMGGDISGRSSNAVVIAVRHVPVSADIPAPGEAWVMAPDGVMRPGTVAADAGGVTNFVAADATGTVAALPPQSVGFTRSILPDSKPAMLLSVDGSPVGYISEHGLTLLFGTLELFNSDLQCTVHSLDGSAAAPAISWKESPATGWYRLSVDGDYATAYSHNGQLQAYWFGDGLHFADNHALHGAVELPAGAVTAPALRMSCATGAMGWYRAPQGADFAWSFSHGIYGDILAIGKGGLTLAPGKTISGSGSGLTDLTWAQPLSSTNNTPTAFTPRYIGDRLIIHGATNLIYTAFGTSTNDWRLP